MKERREICFGWDIYIFSFTNTDPEFSSHQSSSLPRLSSFHYSSDTSCACQAGIGPPQNSRIHHECVLESLFPDSTIIDPAETSHEQKKANVFRKIHVTVLSPQMSNLMNCEGSKHLILAKKRIFIDNFRINIPDICPTGRYML